MIGEDNKRIVRRYYEEAFVRRNLEALDELFAPDFVGHSAAVGPFNLDDVREGIARSHEAMPEDEVLIEEQVAEGDLVVTRFVYGWRHDSSMFGEEPSGRWVTMEGVQIDRIKDGRIAERWEIKDLWGAATRLGGKVEFSRDPRP